MRRIVFLAILTLSVVFGAHAQAPNTISTVAGGGTNTGAAKGAYVTQPLGVVRDTLGNTYFSSGGLNIIYKVTPAGQISAYAGNGLGGFSGDGGPATQARLSLPQGIAIDASNNLFISDSSNNRIRRVDASTGVITTVAGSGTQFNGLGFFGGYSGDHGPATSALLNFPVAVAVDKNGNVFIADSDNNVIRMVDTSLEHIITTYAGNGTAGTPGTPNGDGGPAVNAQLNIGPGAGESAGLVTDSSGNLYIADAGDSVVRIVDASPSHIITTFAGNINTIFTFSGDNGPANAAGLNFPSGVSLDGSGNLFISDNGNARMRKVDTTPNHIITTVAGNGSLCLSLATGCGDGGPATSAPLNGPYASFNDSLGNLLIADANDNLIRLVSTGSAPTISTLAGGGTGGDGGQGTAAVVSTPFGIATDSSGNIFFIEAQGGNRVRRWDAQSKTISTYAGNGIAGTGGSDGDGGLATLANLTTPGGLALDKSGALFIAAQFTHKVRRVDGSTKIITTYAGTGGGCNINVNPGCGDGGPATSATFKRPIDVAVDSQGNLYVSDFNLNRVRRVDAATGIITNYAGTNTAGYSGDGGPATSATLHSPRGLVFDANDNLYVADSLNNVIRKIDNTANHIITTYAFNGVATFGGDGGSALSASMQGAGQVALDANGNLFVSGGADSVVRRIDVNDQTVITVAGDVHNLDGGFSGDGGPSTQALLAFPGVAIDANKNMYIADSGNARIRLVHLAPVAQVTPTTLKNFGPVLVGDTATPQLLSISNNGLDDLTVSNLVSPTGFTVANLCMNFATMQPAPVAPGGTCILEPDFIPPAGAAGGTVFSGNVTFATNDTAHASFNFPVTGTAAAAPGATLTVTLAGSGTGTVTGQPAGLVNGTQTTLNCSNTSNLCALNFAVGQVVTLIAFGNPGSTLTGWNVNGSTTTCPATALSCTLTMSTAQNVTVTFGTASVGVAALGNGNGTITDNLAPHLISCTFLNGTTSGSCSATYPQGTQSVTLTATPDSTSSSTFAGWLGFCSASGVNTSGTGPCTLNLTLAGLPGLNGALATAVFSGPPKPFAQGQVFIGTVDGMIFVYNPNGTLAQVLNSGSLGGVVAGMDFDKNGNLYGANLGANTVERFVGGTATPTTFGTGYNSAPLGLVIDPLGNVFVGQSSGDNTLLEFANAVNGPATSTFFPAFDQGGIGYLELLDDGARVLYTSSTQTSTTSGSVRNYDIANNHQNPDFAVNLPGGPAFALRELSDKSVLVANATEIVHLDPNGNQLGSPSPYKPGGGGLFFALNLNPDGASFWAGDALSGKVYQVRISDGTVLNTINTGLGFSATKFFVTVFGIAVFGQPPSGGADLAVTISAPTTDAVNSNITYSISATNNGPLAAAGVSLTDAFPAGVTFVSATAGCTPVTTTFVTVTCPLGTINSGAPPTNISIVVTPTQAGTLNNTVTVNATTPDPIPGNNSFTTSTNVTGSAQLAAITMSAPSSLQLGSGLTYTIQVSNPGSTTLSGISITDSPLPGSLSATSLSPGCTGTTSITCTVGTLTAGQVATFDISIVPTVLGALSNTATVTGGNSASVATTVINNGVSLFVQLGATLPTDFVNSAPGGIDCTTSVIFCTAFFPSGSQVVLTPNGPGFLSWSVVDGSGATCPGTGTCTLTMDVPHSVIAFYNSPVAFLNPNLPNGVVNFPYGKDVSQSVFGGQQPFTFSITSGAPPNGITLNGNRLSGVPTSAGTSSFTLKVTDNVGGTASINTSITVINPPNSQAALLNGPYAALFRGVSDSDGSLRDFVGSLNFNDGGITGTVDTNGNSAGQASQSFSVTGTYTIGPDNRGLMTLNSAGGPAIFAISVGDVHNGIAFSARMIRFDDITGSGQRGAGTLRRQMPSSFTPASFAGPYVFAGTGQDPAHQRAVEIGLFVVDSSGNFGSGSADINDNGTVQPVASITGTYSTPTSGVLIDPTTGRSLWRFNGDTIGTVSYIIDANNVFFLNLDPGASNFVLAGTAERQAPGPFSNASLVGPDVVNAAGPSQQGGSSNVYVAIATTSSVGGVPTVTLNFDSNDSGNVKVLGTQSAPYAIASSGRGTFNFTGNNKPVILYMVRQDHAFIMGTDADPDFGEIDLQHGGPFSNAVAAGKYFFGDREPASPTGGPVSSGVSSISGNSLPFAIDESHARGALDYDTTGTLGVSVAPTGRMTTTPDLTNPFIGGNVVGYLVSPSRAFLADIDPSTSHPQLLEVESLTMPPGVVSPSTVTATFGTTSVGTPLQMNFNISNIGDGLITILSATNATDFTTSGPCVTPLPNILVIAHGSCPLTINFDPSASSPTGVLLHETLTLHTDGGDVTINASGTIVGGTPASFTAIVQGSAIGTVTDGNGGQINCMHTRMAPDSCSATYATGSVITLTESTVGSFLGWLGSPNACTVVGNTCQFTMVAGETVTANFVPGAALFPLTVVPSGAQTGSGTLTSLPPVITNCRVTTTTTSGCTANFPVGELVNLTIQADSGSQFVGWSGTSPTCLGSSAVNCLVAITAAENVFVQLISTTQTFVLSVAETGTGTGKVTSQAGLSPAINCTNVSQTGCSATYNANTSVVLTAVGTNGATFGGWSGGGTPGCSGTGTCSVTMNQIQNVTATFAAPIQQFTLTVADAGTGTGTVKSQQGLIPGISCTTGTTDGCTATYNSGVVVTLTATAGTNSTFAGWTGGTPACAGTGTCTVTMTQAQNVTATFNTGTGPTLTSITISPNPDLVNVGGTTQLTATGNFSDGSQQNLTTTATWTSLGATIATVGTNTGLVTGVKAGGPVTIQAAQSGVIGSTSLTVTATFTGPYQLGQIFASLGNGLVGVFNSTGVLLGTMNTGQPLDAGLTFDPTGNLFVTTFNTPNGVVKLDTTGKLVGPFGSGYTGNPESIVFSHAGNAFVGAAQNPGSSPLVPIFEFDANGNAVASFQVAPENRGSDWVDLLADQKTILYTSEGTSVKSFDISKNQQNPDFATNMPGAAAFALRQLPDGSVLVADSSAALRLSSTGTVLQTYSPNPATQSLFALNLDPDGTSFWTADLSTGVIFRFDITSGKQLTNFTAPSNFVSGLAIFGEKAAGLNNITIIGAGSGAGIVTSTPSGINCGVGGAAGTVCTAPFADNSNVTLTATPRAGSTFANFSDNCNPANPQTNPPTCTVALGIADVPVTVTFNTSSGAPLLTIAKTHNGSFTQGQKGAQYTVTVSNNTDAGPTSGTVTVTDTIPSGLSLVSMAGTGWSCGATPNPPNVCTRSDALNGGLNYPAITVTVNVANGAVSPQVNSAMVSGGGGASATVNDSTTIVALTLVSIAVTPANPTVVVGQTQQFTATGTFSDNSKQDLTASVTWASSNTEAASITAGGLATGLTGGENSTISATFQQGDTKIVGSTLLTVTTVPFILTVTPPAGGNPGAPITVSPGGQLAIGLNLTATPGFNGTVTFSCTSSAPQFLTCTPAPASVTLSGNIPKQVAIVINTFCQGDIPIYGPGPGPGGLGGGLALLLAVGMLGSITWAYRRRSRWALSFAVLMLIALGNAACSGGPGRGPAGRTPPGNYTLFITATANGASQTVQVPIQVTN